MFNKADATTCSGCNTAERERQKARAANPNRAGDDLAINNSVAAAQNRKPEIEAIMVTTETVTALDITERLGIITAECAYGMNVFKDLFASIRNIVGGRSKVLQQTMRDARETVLYELKEEASRLGADAVIAVDLDYVQVGDNNFSMTLLVASGTAVKTSKR